MVEAATPLLIYFGIPLVGLALSRALYARMLASQVPNPPVFRLGLVAFTYGGFLIAVLTMLFWKWSGLASIGAAYLLLVAPILMAGIAIGTYPQRRVSAYHQLAFAMATTYLGILVVLAVIVTIVAQRASS